MGNFSIVDDILVELTILMNNKRIAISRSARFNQFPWAEGKSATIGISYFPSLRDASQSEKVIRMVGDVRRILNKLGYSNDEIVENHFAGNRVQKVEGELIQISIGGDGTLLSTVRGLKNLKTPVLGICSGNANAIPRIFPELMESTLVSLLTGKLPSQNFSPRQLFNVELPMTSELDRSGTPIITTHIPPNLPSFRVINELRVSRHGNSTLSVNYQPHNVVFRGDGIILATATGSSGANSSFGGIVFSHDVGQFCVTSIGSFPDVVNPLTDRQFTTLAIPDPEGKIAIKYNHPPMIHSYFGVEVRIDNLHPMYIPRIIPGQQTSFRRLIVFIKKSEPWNLVLPAEH